MGICQRFNNFVTVEIVTFFFCVTLPITQYGTQELLYRKICIRTISGNTSSAMCHDKDWMRSHKAIEGQTSLWSMYLHIATIIPAIVSTCIQGSIIDKFGFSLPIKLPLIGTLISCSLSAVIALDSIPHELLLIGSIIMGACGHSPTIIMSLYSYVIKDSTEHNKTFRIAIVAACLAIAVTTGFAINGPIIVRFGLSYTFLTAAICIVLAIADSTFRLREPETCAPLGEGTTTRDKIREIFKFDNLKASIQVMCKKRDQSKRLHMHMMNAVFIFSHCAMIGVVDVEYIYLTKEKDFSLNAVSLFMSVSTLLLFLGNISATFILSKKLGLHLTYLAIIGSVSSVIYYAGLSLGNSFAALWIFNGFRTFTGLVPVSARSYISGCVDQSEQGIIMSFMSIMEGLFKLGATLVFNGLYPSTLHVWPGLMLMVAAVLCAIALPILILIRWHEKRPGEAYSMITNEDDPAEEGEGNEASTDA